MTTSNTNRIYENENTESLIKEIYRINPSVQFSTIRDYITEKEALLLYNAVLRTPQQNQNVIYIPVLSM